MKTKALATAISTIVFSYGACTYAGDDYKKESNLKNEKSQQSSNVTNDKSTRSFQSYNDGSTVTITGTVKKIDGHDFIMNHGQENIEVELEGWNWNKPDLEKYLAVGQKVTVTGEVDNDWFDDKELEAKNIYLDTERVYFYTVDVSPAYAYVSTVQDSSNTNNANNNQKRTNSMKDGSYFAVRGDIKSIEGDEIVLSSNNRTYRVNLEQLGYDPLDKEGLQQLSVGDRVYVSGEVDDNFFERKEIDADVVVTLNDMSGNSVATN